MSRIKWKVEQLQERGMSNIEVNEFANERCKICHQKGDTKGFQFWQNVARWGHKYYKKQDQ